MSSQASGYPHAVVLESQACPMGCAVDDSFVLEGMDRIHNIPGRFNVVRCRTCTLMRTNPRPTPQSIGAYYPDDYAPYHTIAAGSAVVASHTTLKGRVKRWLGMESRVLPSMVPGRMLEIGCASGAYLEQMRAKGWKAIGIEFSKSAALESMHRVIYSPRESVRNVQLEVLSRVAQRPILELSYSNFDRSWKALNTLHQSLRRRGLGLRQWSRDLFLPRAWRSDRFSAMV